MSFNSGLGFGADNTEVTVQLVEDKCTTTPKVIHGYVTNSNGSRTWRSGITYGADRFVPQPIGTPLFFIYDGFVYGGLLYNWERNRGPGGSTISVRLRSPSIVLDSSTLVLQNADDSPIFFSRFGIQASKINNMINVPYINGVPSWCNDVGVTWQMIKRALYFRRNSLGVLYQRFFWFRYDKRGRPFSYKLYLESGIGPDNLRFNGDSTTCMEAISRAARASGGRIYIDLLPDRTGQATAIIRVRYNNFDINPAASGLLRAQRINAGASYQIGVAYQKANATDGNCAHNVMKWSAGLEFSDVVSQSAVQGEYRHEIWQSWQNDNAGGNFDQIKNNLHTYWGKHACGPYAGQGVVSYGRGDGENFTTCVANQPWGFLVGGTYNISVLELRAALAGFDSWYMFITYFKPMLLPMLGLPMPNAANTPFLAASVSLILNLGLNINASNWLSATWAAARAKDLKQELLQQIHQYVTGFGQYYGKQFVVDVPEVYCCNGGVEPEPNTNWERTDAGYMNNPYHPQGILGIPWNSPVLQIFKVDDGRCGPVFYWDERHIRANENVLSVQNQLNFNNISGTWFSPDGTRVWTGASFKELMYNCRPGLPQPIALLETPGIEMRPAVAASGVVEGLHYALLQLIWGGIEGGSLTPGQKVNLHAWLRTSHASSMKGMSLAPAMFSPSAAAVPMKSNYNCYGPFEAYLGVNGRCEWERDTSLAPWLFNGYSLLLQAGSIKASAKLSNQYVLESGSITYAGGPSQGNISQLGAQLAGTMGPNVTNVNIAFGTGGVTTTINFRTFVRNFGEKAQSDVEWLQLIGQKSQQFQRAFGLAFAGGLAMGIAIGGAGMFAGAIAPLLFGGGAGEGVGGGADGGAGGGFGAGGAGAGGLTALKDGLGSTEEDYTHHESWSMNINSMREKYLGNVYKDNNSFNKSNLQTDSEKWKNLAFVSNEGLVRPFTIGDSGQKYFSKWEDPSGDESTEGICENLAGADFNSGIEYYDHVECCLCSPSDGTCDIPINSETLNPFMTMSKASELATNATGGTDIWGLVTGTEPSERGFYPYPTDSELRDCRPMGLRGPLVLSGWGYDMDGCPVPADPDDKKKFLSDWLRKAKKWKTGPVDLRWDDDRKVWTAPPNDRDKYGFIIEGTLEDELPPGGEGTLNIPARCQEGNQGEERKVKVTNRLGQPLCGGQRVFAYYNPFGCEYVIIQAEFMPVCVVTDICAQEPQAGLATTGSPGATGEEGNSETGDQGVENCLDLTATTRIIFVQSPPTIGVNTRFAMVKSCKYDPCPCPPSPSPEPEAPPDDDDDDPWEDFPCS
jgi:hypothetical protein